MKHRRDSTKQQKDQDHKVRTGRQKHPIKKKLITLQIQTEQLFLAETKRRKYPIKK